MNHVVERGGHLALVVLLILFSNPALAATIVVDETTCTLVDAITAANTDTPVGGCAAGSGPDTIELTTDVTLTEAIPQVTSAIAIDGDGFVLQRVPSQPPFVNFFWVLASGTLTIDHLTLRNSVGPAIYMNGSTVELTNSTLVDNGSLRGGAVHNRFGTLTVTNSTLSGNTAFVNEYGAFGTGGAIYNLDGTVSLTNSTLSGNTSESLGSAVFTYYGSLTMTNTTVTGNTGNGAVYVSTPVTLIDTIVAGNDVNCFGAHPVIDNGNNFADDESCGPGFADITPGVDFETTLADNGGPTLTHALLPGSVAIDAAGDCGLATDQRGFPRDRFACDSGSVEFQGGADTPASSPLGLLVLLAILMTVAWAILRPKWGARHPS
jgi:hypothetical protein